MVDIIRQMHHIYRISMPTVGALSPQDCPGYILPVPFPLIQLSIQELCISKFPCNLNMTPSNISRGLFIWSELVAQLLKMCQLKCNEYLMDLYRAELASIP